MLLFADSQYYMLFAKLKLIYYFLSPYQNSQLTNQKPRLLS